MQGWLDYHRATLLWKCRGLTGEQLVLQPVQSSRLSLLGLVRRWVYLHMIEEYARHHGHADLLRELIDGVIGD